MSTQIPLNEYGFTEALLYYGRTPGYMLDSFGIRPLALNLGVVGMYRDPATNLLPAARTLGIHTGGIPARATTDGNDSTPSTTETYVQEIFVPAGCRITGIRLFNGSVAAGNVTVALADAMGTPITGVVSASTAVAGTDAYQSVPFAVPYDAVGPAKYHIMVQYSSATARYNTHTIGSHGVLVQTGGTYGIFVGFTPPTSFVTNVGNIAAIY